MRHLRKDYEAIQPWPTKRPHHGKEVKFGGIVLNAITEDGIDPAIPDDEPVFILRAKDVSAAPAVRYWALHHLWQNPSDVSFVDRVIRWADEMEAYGRVHGAKVADTPPSLLLP